MNIQSVRFEAAYGTAEQLRGCTGPEISFVGRSNVGKSSLLNKLFNRKSLAKTSSTPGKTATINFFPVDGGITFVDLPGYGYAKVGKADKDRWATLIGGYFAQERDFKLVVCLIDIRHEATKLDMQMLDFLDVHDLPFLIVFTKADKLKSMQRKKRMAELRAQLRCPDDEQTIAVSSADGTGIDELRRAIEAACRS